MSALIYCNGPGITPRPVPLFPCRLLLDLGRGGLTAPPEDFLIGEERNHNW
ncbi:hypothetical protein FTUN_2546 [Frigoriglobus tundricola]|uniref:Uncharacterized protein n=1 Tax=Frigoriglobus tundricola TaxID=2774151 RepID=A0A6M5YNS8_9BACT|nr:hypothetical protein FTUN_2546 [Frigoriglobus tundricola]